MVLLSSAGVGSSYAQFITVLIMFVLVLGVTAVVTKWLAGYQKQLGVGSNIQVIETSRISNNKYIQILRVGDTYMVIAVCKDTITLLGQISEEGLKPANTGGDFSFRELLERVARRNSAAVGEPEESREHDER